MSPLRFIALATVVGCGACNVVSGLTDFSVTGDAGTGAAGGGGAGGCAGCGEHVWSDSFSAAGRTRGRGVAADKSGNVVVAGNADTAVDFGGGELPHVAGFDVVVAELGSLGSHAWSRRLGGEGQEWVRGLALDPGGDNDVLVVGQFERQIIFEEGLHEAWSTVENDYDGFVVRLSGSSGQTLWAHAFGPATRQSATDVAVDSNGEIVVVGDFRLSIDLPGQTLGQVVAGEHDDVYVARFDELGGLLWSQAYGDAADDFAEAVAVDGEGNVVVAGYFYGAIDFGLGPLTSDASPAVFVAKLAPEGTALWNLALPGQGAHVARALDLDADAIVVAGAFSGEIQIDTETHLATEDTLWVAKLDHDGVIQWGASYPGATDMAGPGPVIALDSAGNVLLTGPLLGTASFGGDLLTSVTDANEEFTEDVFVAKLDGAGHHLWSQSYGGTGSDYGAAIAADLQDNVLVTGTFSGDVSFGDELLKTTDESLFLLKLTP